MLIKFGISEIATLSPKHHTSVGAPAPPLNHIYFPSLCGVSAITDTFLNMPDVHNIAYFMDNVMALVNENNRAEQ